jgi:hypothetical protein
MRIAFMIGQFPSLSETFILNQITGLLDRGHTVSILAERASGEAQVHPDVERYRLRECARYELLPESVVGRAFGLASRWRPDHPGIRRHHKLSAPLSRQPICAALRDRGLLSADQPALE